MKRKVTYVQGDDGKFYRNEEAPVRRRKKRRLWKIFVIPLGLIVAAGAAAVGVLAYYEGKQEFTESFYYVQSDKLSDHIRTVLLSDLHLEEYGENNEELVERISSLQPDFVSIVGDMNDKDVEDYQVVTNLCEQLVEIAPVYYSPGNHEWEEIVHKDSPIMSDLEAIGVEFLADREVITEINGNTIKVGGLAEAPGSYEKYGKPFLESFVQGDEFKLLLVHYPEYFDGILDDKDIDVALCGHAHGGQIRLPFIGGLYTVDQGWFPKLTEGVHQINDISLVISRGLGDGVGKWLPRINNTPELVIVDMNWH